MFCLFFDPETLCYYWRSSNSHKISNKRIRKDIETPRFCSAAPRHGSSFCRPQKRFTRKPFRLSPFCLVTFADSFASRSVLRLPLCLLFWIPAVALGFPGSFSMYGKPSVTATLPAYSVKLRFLIRSLKKSACLPCR